MIHVEIAADLNAEHDTGYVWTFLDEATEPSMIVHLDVLPGAIGSYVELARRIGVTG